VVPHPPDIPADEQSARGTKLALSLARKATQASPLRLDPELAPPSDNQAGAFGSEPAGDHLPHVVPGRRPEIVREGRADELKPFTRDMLASLD
jgi:hypothetical protein